MPKPLYLVGASAAADVLPSVLFDFDLRGDARRCAEALLRGASRPWVWVWVTYPPSTHRHPVAWWPEPRRAGGDYPPALPSPFPASCPVEGCAGEDHPLLYGGYTKILTCGECGRRWTPRELVAAWRERRDGEPLLVFDAPAWWDLIGFKQFLRELGGDPDRPETPAPATWPGWTAVCGRCRYTWQQERPSFAEPCPGCGCDPLAEVHTDLPQLRAVRRSSEKDTRIRDSDTVGNTARAGGAGQRARRVTTYLYMRREAVHPADPRLFRAPWCFTGIPRIRCLPAADSYHTMRWRTFYDVRAAWEAPTVEAIGADHPAVLTAVADSDSFRPRMVANG